MKLYAVILCGGRGERFWPRSRRRLPKQFIALFGKQSLLQQTSKRVEPLCPVSRQLYVAPRDYEKVIRWQTGAEAANVLLEPSGRNTAPAIGMAAAHLAAVAPDATMVVLPADHLVGRQQQFLASVRLAARLAQEGLLVTFGIPPTRPDPGYGYIHVGREVGGRGRLVACEVRGFREKPDGITARKYLAQGSYLWNSGMFVWRVDSILAALRKFMPTFHAGLKRFRRAVGTDSASRLLNELYRKTPAISIDYAVMEKARNIAAVRATFSWDDVGSWLALERHRPRDRQGNVTTGVCFVRATRNCIIDSDAGAVAALGVKDLVVVRSGDAVLVAHRDRVGQIKELLERVARHPQASGLL